jgi:hypothetical protein
MSACDVSNDSRRVAASSGATSTSDTFRKLTRRNAFGDLGTPS